MHVLYRDNAELNELSKKVLFGHSNLLYPRGTSAQPDWTLADMVTLWQWAGGQYGEA